MSASSVMEKGRAGASTTNYVPALDGLRAVSIAFVIIGHCGLEHLVPGGLGVTLFFFISGLLISRLLLVEFQRTGRINLSRFYFMRFLRLMPALYLFVLIGGIAFAVIGFTISPLNYSAALFYWANYFGIYLNDVYGGFAATPHESVRRSLVACRRGTFLLPLSRVTVAVR